MNNKEKVIFGYSMLTEQKHSQILDPVFENKKEAVYLFVILRTMTEKEIYTEKQIRLARYAKALGHPIRVYVMETLSKQSCCYSGDLTEILPIAKSTLSQHLKELRDAGLIQGEIESPKIKYCINKDNWVEAQLLFKEFLKPQPPVCQ